MTPSETPPAINRLWQDAFNAGDGHRLVALYSNDAIVLPPGGELVQGLDEVTGLMTAHIGEGLRTAITPVETEVRGDLAWQIGTWRLQSSDGKDIDRGKFLQLWRKELAGWRITRDIWNSSQSAA